MMPGLGFNEQPSPEGKAEECTLAIVADLENSIQGSPERAVIFGTSAISAVRIIFARYGIDSSLYRELYEDYWKPVVDREEND
jgi:hypothetical protein